ncbi:hypothetical protein IAR50_002589 [Cryptococcus sp. DSM 104548]
MPTEIENRVGDVPENAHDSTYSSGPWERVNYMLTVDGEEIPGEIFTRRVIDGDIHPGTESRTAEAEIQNVEESAIRILTVTRYKVESGNTWSAKSYEFTSDGEDVAKEVDVELTKFSQLCVCDELDCTLSEVPEDM